MIKEVCDKDYLDRLKLNLWTLEKRRNRADLIKLLKIYKGFTTVHLSPYLLWIVIIKAHVVTWPN